MKPVQDAYIVSATRAPIGKSHRGYFRHTRPDDLLATVLRSAVTQAEGLDPAAIEGWVYRGTSLGLPKLIEAITWKTFQKTFWRHPDGRLLGWNVRLEQDGIDAPSRPADASASRTCEYERPSLSTTAASASPR